MIEQIDRAITEYIEQDPNHPGVYDARLVHYGVPVWALAAHLRANSENIEQVAAEYKLPYEAVEAALAYYHKHEASINARIEANEVPDDGGLQVMPLYGAEYPWLNFI